MGGGEINNIMEVCSAIIASLCYSYFFSSRIPKGVFRLFSLLPIFSLFTLLPFRLTYAFPAAVTAFFITWLTNFKLLLFAFDSGPLSNSNSLPIFITFACLPIRNSEKSSKPAKSKKLPLNLATETVLFAVLVGILSDFREIMHPKILLAIYCCLVFLLVDVLIFVSNAIVRALVGLQLEPPSDEPYLSSSLQDFWGQRWNLMVTNTLRHTVYKPVRSASGYLIGPKWAVGAAVMATFLVSGLMHELIFYYATPVRPTWEMTGFFVLHGACVVAELSVKRAVSGRWRLPSAVATPLTLGFVVVTSSWLFFPPLTRNGADVRVIEEFKMFTNFVKRNLLSIALW